MENLLSKKLVVTLGALATVILQIDQWWKALIVGGVAAVYVVAQAFVDSRKVEDVAGLVKRGIDEAQRATKSSAPMLALLLLSYALQGCASRQSLDDCDRELTKIVAGCNAQQWVLGCADDPTKKCPSLLQACEAQIKVACR